MRWRGERERRDRGEIEERRRRDRGETEERRRGEIEERRRRDGEELQDKRKIGGGYGYRGCKCVLNFSEIKELRIIRQTKIF